MQSKHGEYLGEEDVTDQFDFSEKEIALKYIEMYKGIDGSHHKDWLLDQVARILNGSPVKVKKAKWEDGHTEIRYRVGTCKEYEDWVHSVKMGENGPDTYSYDEGVPP